MFAKCQIKQINQIFLLQDSSEPLICNVMPQEANRLSNISPNNKTTNFFSKRHLFISHGILIFHRKHFESPAEDHKVFWGICEMGHLDMINKLLV